MALPEVSPVSVLHINAARTWRGGEQQTLYLAHGLKKRGIQQAIAGRAGSELEQRAAAAGIPFFPLKIGSELDVLAGREISQLARKNHLRILHAHTAHAHSIGLLARLFYREGRLVVTRRVDFHIRGLSGLKYRNNLVDRFVAISHNVRQIMEEDGVPAGKIRLAHSGIDLSRFAKLPSAVDLRKEFSIKRGLVIGAVGALVDHKDQRTLIRAFASLPEAGSRVLIPGQKARRAVMPPCTLLLVGDGDRGEEYRDLAHSLFGRDLTAHGHRIVFAGFRTDVLHFLALFDVFAMSSKEEGLGTSVLDAMACSLPLVVTDGGGLREMADEGRGALVSKAQDPVAFSENLMRLALLPDLRKRFGVYNKKRVRDFSVDRMVEENLRIYQELV